MIRFHPFPEELRDRVHALVLSGVAQAEVTARMRNPGLDLLDSMKLVHEFYGVSRNQDKQIVYCSDAWADMREEYDGFHEAAFAAAKEAGFEEVEVAALRPAS